MSTTRSNVALIGCGMVASAYVESFANLSGSLRLSGVLASRPANSAAFLAKHGAAFSGAQAYADMDALLSDEPDFAVIITPPNVRAPYVAALADAGIPILMEKPVERTLNAARKLVDICAHARVSLGIVLQHRVRPSAQKLRALLAEHDFGSLRLVEISVPWWRGQGYYDEPGRGSLARDGGGVLISQAIHTLDLALQFTGPVDAVTAMCRTTRFHDMETEDFVTAGLMFENGAVGSLIASTASYPGRTEEIILHYANASVTLRSAELVVAWQSGETQVFGSAQSTGAGGDPMAFTSAWHQAVIADFIACIDSGATPVASGASALDGHALIEAIINSGAQGRTVSVDKGY
ncbi:Gfo/Idh/MocA family protein [Celeribacter marinus]|uniref:Gluconokinase / oxidoreductase domain n=1 Tax=Celeribacter marinus TaxID=1397108 RepID=A0A0P0ADC2_9RHOB|nr:Gfo/Idh/MocA family oxidoreductase [Celeribacter marinus]ALI56196.1 gluconokinase / oxidoreductase domain [Celeribacter marinus]SFK85420.1 Predicted dehydrogenase [Celeribacter marinus]